MNAWPAERSEEYDGWVLRFAGGFTRRANSINIVDPSTLPLAEKVAHCERAYNAEGLRTVFKFAEIPLTKKLDKFLDQMGYRREAETSVMKRRLARSTLFSQAHVHFDSELKPDWLEAAIELGAIHDNHRRHLEGILKAIRPAHAFASIRVGRKIAAMGLGVVENHWLGLFEIATAPEFRRLGYATTIISQTMNWGKSVGANNTYLQVMDDNESAMNLYHRLDFKHQYKYWYRAKSASPPG